MLVYGQGIENLVKVWIMKLKKYRITFKQNILLLGGIVMLYTMRCKYCGEKVDQDQYCTSCGAYNDEKAFREKVNKQLTKICLAILLAVIVLFLIDGMLSKREYKQRIITPKETYIFVNNRLYRESGMMTQEEFDKIPETEWENIGLTEQSYEWPLKENMESFEIESRKEVIFHKSKDLLYISYKPIGTDFDGYLVFE